jgi:hypothetical protein
MSCDGFSEAQAEACFGPAEKACGIGYEAFSW